AMCRAVEPELAATAWLAPVISAKRCSNCATKGPWTTQPLSSGSCTARSSSSPKTGLVMGIVTRAMLASIVRVAAILGLNAYHGDAAAALVVDGELVAAAEEERFNRVKHCAGFPALAAAWCLAEGGIRPEELDHLAVSRDPRANVGQKLLRTIRHGASARYLKARLQNAAKIRDVKSALADALGVEVRAEVHNIEHHQAHVASAFFVSPFDDAAVLSVDGFGDFCSTMTAVGRGNSFRVIDRVLFPHSLGIFYAA